MWFELALALGYPVRVLQQQMTSKEFEQWKVFKQLNPWGLDRLDTNFAMLASVLANIWRRKDSPVYKISDFALKYGNPEPVEDKKTQQTKLASDILLWAHAMNASRKKKKAPKS